MISGLISTMGRFSVSGSRLASITNSRTPAPTCGAARPTPGASYIVASRSAASDSISGVTRATGSATFFRRGSGWIRIVRRLMPVDLGDGFTISNNPRMQGGNAPAGKPP